MLRSQKLQVAPLVQRKQNKRYGDGDLTNYMKIAFDNKILTAMTVVSTFISTFVIDFFTGNPFLYPLRSIIELFRNFTAYSLAIINIFSFYLLAYTLVNLVYWPLVTPIYTAVLVFFGPIGLLTVWIHTLLHTNFLTIIIVRSTNINENIVYKCIHLNNNKIINYEKTTLANRINISTTCKFWSLNSPNQLFKCIIYGFAFLSLLVFSFIPIIGPFISNILLSPVICKKDASKAFEERGLTSFQTQEILQGHIGRYVSLGFVAGLLETIPIQSGLLVSTNTIACTLLALNSKLPNRPNKKVKFSSTNSKKRNKKPNNSNRKHKPYIKSRKTC